LDKLEFVVCLQFNISNYGSPEAGNLVRSWPWRVTLHS